jgi:hypothetical protein
MRPVLEVEEQVYYIGISNIILTFLEYVKNQRSGFGGKIERQAGQRDFPLRPACFC